jgi:ferritin-like metal-binding protein YciE
MTSTDIDDQLVAYLSDAHAIERQALAQLHGAPKIAEVQRFADALRQHEHETEGHERLVRGRLEAHDAGPSAMKDVAMAAGGVGFALFARLQPDTPGKLAAHAYSYEHLEFAAYELLRRVAQRAGDAETVAVAREIGEQEAAMGRRIADLFEETAMASVHDTGVADRGSQLVKYLTDAHALETQAVELLEKAQEIGGDARLVEAYSQHLTETKRHRRRVETLLKRREASPSAIKDAAMKLGALNWGMFFAAQPDTPGKLAAFAYAFEHLEIAAYEQLRYVAQSADDAEAERVAEEILQQERAAAQKIAERFDVAVDASLQALGHDASHPRAA